METNLSIPFNENIAMCIGYTYHPDPLMIISQYFERGSLRSVFEKGEKTETSVKILWIEGIANGLEHLHNHGIIHRDLACRNTLVDKNDTVKICDFGLSRKQMNESHKTFSSFGPLFTMAPEQILERTSSKSSDIFSFGLLMWEIFTEMIPWEAELVNATDIMVIVKRVVINNERLKIPSSMPDYLKSIVQECWLPLPEDRLTIQQVKEKLKQAK